jgi:hypothetical protein
MSNSHKRNETSSFSLSTNINKYNNNCYNNNDNYNNNNNYYGEKEYEEDGKTINSNNNDLNTDLNENYDKPNNDDDDSQTNTNNKTVDNKFNLQSMQNSITEASYIEGIEKNYPAAIKKIVTSVGPLFLNEYTYLLEVW